MGLKVEPAYIGQTGYLHPVELDRNLVEGIFGRSGASRAGEFRASTGVGTRAVAVSPGRYHLLGVENAQQGGYFVWSDAVETFLLAAGVGNPRIDTIILRVIDDQYGTISGSPRAEFEVVQGVAAASPVALADSVFNVGGASYKPGAWHRIADCRVNVSDTTIPGGQITNMYQHTRNSARSMVARSTLTIADATYGDRKVDEDTGIWYWWNGTAWHPEPGQLVSETLSTAGDITPLAGVHQILISATIAAGWMIAGCRYELYFESAYTYSAGSACVVNFRHAAGASVAITDTLVGVKSADFHTANKDIPFNMRRHMTPGASGQRTIGVAANFYSGTGNMAWRRNSNNEMVLCIRTAGV